MNATTALLFESSDNYHVQQDPENADWVSLVQAIRGERFEVLERRYYLALSHLRQQQARPPLPGQTELHAQGKQQAFEAMLETMEQRKAARKRAGGEPSASEVFVETLPAQQDPSLPAALRDLTVAPPPLRHILAGAGRPPCDARHPRKAPVPLAEQYDGVHHLTPNGVPICEQGFRFVLLGRDLEGEHFLWAAPDNDQGQPVCESCTFEGACQKKGGRRSIRIPRNDQPHIDWDHPQHSARERALYGRRTGVERAIKRIKVDLDAEHLTHRNAHRVQAHLDRKLLTLHLLLAIAASS